MKKLLSTIVVCLLTIGCYWQTSLAATSTSVGQASKSLPLIALKALDKNNNPMNDALVQIVPDGPGWDGKTTYTTQTDSEGRAVVQYQLTDHDLAMAKKNNGILNFLVIVSKKGQEPDVYHFFRDINIVDNNQLKSMALDSIPEMGPKSVEVKPNGGFSEWAKGLKLLKESAEHPSQNQNVISPNDYVCQYNIVGTSVSYDLTKVGELHNGANSWAEFTYGATADSTIDTAYSSDGSSFGINGSAHISNSLSGSAHFGTDTGSGFWYQNGYQMLSKFEYVKYHWSNGVCGGSYYTVEPAQWVGGMQLGSSVGYRDGSHTSYYTYWSKGSDYTRSSGTAVSYSVGVTTPWVSLGARSGYSSHVKLQWHFDYGSGYLYGTSSYPSTAPVIYAE